MQDLVTRYLNKFKKERRMRRHLATVLVVLACVVSLGVYWQLKLTGAALTNETFCGKEEHVHDSEDCYEWVLVCGYDDVTETSVTAEELEALWEAGESETAASVTATALSADVTGSAAETSGHTHTAECYQTVTKLVCGLTESEGHTHSESCYSTVLTCGLEESEGHTHSENCYDEEGNLICGLEESEGHTHDESCYTTELTCGLTGTEGVSETSEGHTHDASCYETEEVLICGQDEADTAADSESNAAVISNKEHVHTAACYEKVLVCELEEHTHSAACLSDNNADVETAEDWEATLPANLSDNWAEAVVEIAQSQLGYTESIANFTLDEDGETQRGYTRYGAWAGNEYGDWDALFASFCLSYAGLSTEDFPQATGAYAWAVKLQNLDLYADAADYTPAAGDLVFTDSDADGKIDRVGIVITVDEENDSLTVIEGDCAVEDGADAVCEVEYSLSDEEVVGYGVLPEYEAGATYTLTYEGEDYIVVVTYGDDAELPEGVELIASEYEKTSEKYLDRYAEAAELYGWNTEDAEEGDSAEETDYHGFRLFNIGLYLDGEEVEPAADVIVTITYLDQEVETGSNTVTHFGEEGTETLEAETAYEDGAQTTTFASGSFSDFGISVAATYTYTVNVDETTTILSSDMSNANQGTWSSANETIATVSKSTSYGQTTITIKGESAGNTTITHTYNSYGSSQTDIYYVTVTSAGSIVLNLGNGNGVLQDSDYSGGSQGSGGTNLRYTVNVSTAADEDNTVTINLPADNDLDKTFTVATTADGTPITQALGNEAAPYAWKLVGWVNIATGEYYDVSGGSVTATVDLDNENVFYADWIAESYDYGTSSTLGEDTSDFVKIEMFDYNELFNLYSVSLTQNGLTSESWADSGNFYSDLLQSGTILDRSFIFQNCKTSNNDDSYSSSNGLLGFPTNLYIANTQYWNWNDETTYDVWKMSSASSSPILSKLFDTTGSTIGVEYVGSANYLFQVDSNGYYYFDSDKNGAAYNQTAQRFYLSSTTTTVSQGTWNGYSAFFPYNEVGSYTSISNGTLNYWFGMSVELDFYLPNDVGTSGGNQYNDADMVFEFSGDDDVWVYVDDKLVLNLSGIHSEISGSINFSTGVVTTNGETSNLSDLLSDCSAGTHTLKVYYLERGAWDSNLSIKFNVVPRWKYETASAGTTSVTKVWKDASGNVVENTSAYSDVTMGLFEKTTTTASAGNTVYYGSGSYTLDSNGCSYDSTTGYMNAYVEGGYLYVLVDTQQVTNDNNWTYTWELLDSDKTYEVRELTSLSNYKTTSSYSALQSYEYWSAVGYEELNGTISKSSNTYTVVTAGLLKDGLQIVLTDGAQNGGSTATGYVIDSSDGISTKSATFSQSAAANSSETYTYGVTSDTYISATSVWTVELTGGYDDFTENGSPYYAPTFYLKDTSGNYLAVTGSNGNYSLTTVSSSESATAFSYNSLGELNTVGSTGVKVTITADGSYAVVTGRLTETSTLNVKIYVKQDVTTTGKSYTITNTLLPTITLKKVDSTNGTSVLSGAIFTLQNSKDNTYYSYSGTAVTWVTNEQELTTNSSGIISFIALPDGTYTLTEVTAPDGYNQLSGTISVTVSEGVVTAADYSGSESGVVSVDTNKLTITVTNTPGVELPETGGVGTTLFTILGLLLCGGAALLLYRRRVLF